MAFLGREAHEERIQRAVGGEMAEDGGFDFFCMRHIYHLLFHPFCLLVDSKLQIRSRSPANLRKTHY